MACIIIAIDRRDHLLVFLFARLAFPSDRANRARGRNPTSRASILLGNLNANEPHHPSMRPRAARVGKRQTAVHIRYFLGS